MDALRKKVEARQVKVEALRASVKPGWEGEVDKLVAGESMVVTLLTSAIEQDSRTIAGLLARRVFIRACMWHELAVVLHSRQAAQAALGWRAWVQGARDAVNAESRIWETMSEDVDRMPFD